jgi:hypothetical protein
VSPAGGGEIHGAELAELDVDLLLSPKLVYGEKSVRESRHVTDVSEHDNDSLAIAGGNEYGEVTDPLGPCDVAVGSPEALVTRAEIDETRLLVGHAAGAKEYLE